MACKPGAAARRVGCGTGAPASLPTRATARATIARGSIRIASTARPRTRTASSERRDERVERARVDAAARRARVTVAELGTGVRGAVLGEELEQVDVERGAHREVHAARKVAV